MAKEQIYKDLDLNFSVNPFTGDINKKTGLDAVKSSMKNILLYAIFEKHYSPEYDLGIRGLLFENKSYGFKNYLEKRIRILLESYEPRISIQAVIVKSGDNENSVGISVYYIAKETQNKETLELFLGKYDV